ncbi:MAG: hypothetical protein K1X94_27105, partial [Sandaracinaceae bacterium]|nr:hypothetical protein [Sandaracinaceae bacterium]
GAGVSVVVLGAADEGRPHAACAGVRPHGDPEPSPARPRRSSRGEHTRPEWEAIRERDWAVLTNAG